MKYEDIKVGMKVYKIGDYNKDPEHLKLMRGVVVENEPPKRAVVDWKNDRGQTYECSQDIFQTIDEAVDDMNEWVLDIRLSLYHKLLRECPEVTKYMNEVVKKTMTPISEEKK